MRIITYADYTLWLHNKQCMCARVCALPIWNFLPTRSVAGIVHSNVSTIGYTIKSISAYVLFSRQSVIWKLLNLESMRRQLILSSMHALVLLWNVRRNKLNNFNDNAIENASNRDKMKRRATILCTFSFEAMFHKAMIDHNVTSFLLVINVSNFDIIFTANFVFFSF